MIPRIRQIQIQNYKSIERAVVDLEPFTVFVGLNGAGKSNVVDALAFVQECLSQSVEEAFRRRGGTNLFPRWSPRADRTLALRLLIDLADGSRADYAYEVGWSSREGFKVIHEKCLVLSPNAEEAGFEVAEGRFTRPIPGIRLQLVPDRLALSIASAAEELRPLYNFLTSIRLYSIAPFDLYLSGAQESDPGEDLESHGSNAAAVLRALKERDPESHAQVVRLLSLINEGIQEVGTSALDNRLSLIFDKDVGEEKPARFYAPEMSEGTIRVLCLLLAIRQPRRPSVLIIEEPEATVHPASAELILEILLDATHDYQVLVTTHSPDLLDAKELSYEQLRIVTMKEGRTIIAPPSEAGRQSIHERLYSPGELLRIDELSQDSEAAQESARRLDLFGETETPPHP